MNKTTAICSMEKFDNRQLNSVGSSRIRVRWLLNYWDEAEEYVIGKKYEVIIFQKVYWGTMMDAFEGIKILDLCDPDWLEGKPVFEYIDKADAVVTSSEPLAAYIRKLRPKALVKCIPDRIYLPEATPVKVNHAEKMQKLVWFGYLNNAHYLTRTFDELISRNLELIVIADSQFEPPMPYRNKLRINNIPYSFSSINKDLIQYDAVLMPDPVGDERAKYKSPNKTIQSWAIGMPVIKVPEDFDRLATRAAREEESKQKRKEVEEKYSVELSVKEYRDLIEEIRKTKNK